MELKETAFPGLSLIWQIESRRFAYQQISLIREHLLAGKG
jgi:hypothetical protein